ncbi:MAG: SsrA-binding protein SmpB [Planctomycetes bacterium]|nr:SsrA-binding protein SmpB [Planctomycetota bacterium]
MAKKPKKSPDGRKVVAVNRRARHEFHFVDEFEAGLVLIGSEVKSIRDGKASLSEAYGRVINGEIWLLGLHIAEYDAARYFGHQPRRQRKLLLKRSEIKKIERKVKQTGFTLVPVELYFNERGYAKLKLVLATGKKDHDKREAIKKRDTERELRSYK